jgi:O-antigen/teichoic acid export membrane protein
VSALGSEGLRLARNSAFLGAAQLISLVLGFVTTLIVTDQLGRDEYGLLLGAQRFVVFFAIVMQFGLHPLTVRALASRSGDPPAIVGTVLALRAGLGVLFVAAVLGTAALSGYLPEHRWLLMWLLAIEALGVLSDTYLSVLEGYERMDAAAAIGVVRSIGTATAVAAVAVVGGGLVGFVLAYLIARTLELVVVVFVATRMLAGLRVRWDLAGSLIREAIPFVAIGTVFLARSNVDVMLLTRLSSIPQVSLYGAALNFLGVMLALPLLVQRTLLPALSRLHASGDAAGVAHRSIAAVASLLLPAAGGLCILAEGIMAIYPSGEFSEGAVPLRILAGALPFLAVSMVAATLLTGAGRIWSVVACNAASLVLQTIASVLLIPRLGASGAAIGLFVSGASAAVFFAFAARPLGLRMPAGSLARQTLATAAMGVAITPVMDHFLPIPITLGVGVYATVLLSISPRDSLERRLWRVFVDRARRTRLPGSGS